MSLPRKIDFLPFKIYSNKKIRLNDKKQKPTKRNQNQKDVNEKKMGICYDKMDGCLPSFLLLLPSNGLSRPLPLRC
jgi:hypothetical protein